MNVYQKSFAAGELTPALYGRTDLSKYSTGVRTMRNFFTARHGGAYNRPGTIFRSKAYPGGGGFGTGPIKLVRFDVNSETKYQLEFGELYIRPLRDGQPIPVSPKAIFAITKAASAVVSTTLYHGFKVGDSVTFSGVTGMTQMNGLTGTITAINAIAASITVNINSTGFSTFTPVTNVGTVSLVTPRDVLIVSPYTNTEIKEFTYVQDTRDMVIAHQKHLPQTLRYYGPETWLFSNTSTDPSISAPSSVTSSKPAGTVWYHGVTAVAADTFEETLVATVGSNAAPTSGAPTTISWLAVTNAIEYNIYSGPSPSSMGFRSVVYVNSFVDDDALKPDFSDPPPATRTLFFEFGDTDMLPAAVGYFQQRRFYGNVGPPYPYDGIPSLIAAGFDPRPDRIIASRIGSPSYFLLNRPTEDDDAIVFRLLGKEPQTIRHFLDLGKLAVFTEQGEWVLKGNVDGALTPGEINPTNVSQNGCGYLPPLAIGSTALYVQKQGSVIRTFGFEIQIEGYKGDDVTIYSSHLVDGHRIVAWDFAKVPHPIVWSAREDGVLLGTTFVPEQAILAWHRHDFQYGKVEDVLQSGDDIYLVIYREQPFQSFRSIEKFSARDFQDIKDAIFMDAAVTYDGRNTEEGHTVGITNGTTWDENDTLEISVVSGAGDIFEAGDVGKFFHITGEDGTIVKFTITAFHTGGWVDGTPDRLVPVSMRFPDFHTDQWAWAVKTVSGLNHLTTLPVSVIGDGFVVASPNNPDYDQVVVSGSSITLENAYSVIHVGLPIVADIETLNIDTANGETILDRKKLITKVNMWVENSRGIWAGGVPPDDDSQDPLEGLTTGFDELKIRNEEDYDTPMDLVTRVVEINLEAQWNSHGRVFIRQIDPLPLAILSIAPGGLIPFGGNGG